MLLITGNAPNYCIYLCTLQSSLITLTQVIIGSDPEDAEPAALLAKKKDNPRPASFPETISVTSKL